MGSNANLTKKFLLLNMEAVGLRKQIIFLSNRFVEVYLLFNPLLWFPWKEFNNFGLS
jgi:hypothetical protein